MGNQTSTEETPSPPPKPLHPTTSKYTERETCAAQHISCAVSGMKGWRPTMEDQHLFEFSMNVRFEQNQDNVSLNDHSIFAVFDGHGGSYTSTYLKQNFISVLSLRPELQRYVALPKNGPHSRADANGVQLLKEAVTNTFLRLDELLRELHEQMQKESAPSTPVDVDLAPFACNMSKPTRPVATSPMDRSGSTAVVVVLTPHHILCANAGDSRAILRRHGRVLPLSFDHKPSNIVERRRILQANGFVKRKRVDGDLAVSRAFGDFCMKQQTLPPQKVICHPDFICYPRDLAGDEFIVLACDGVWDVANNDMCSDFIQDMLHEGEVDLGNICEEALDTCLELKSRDNMTILLIGLPALKGDFSSRARFHNALWGPRRTRQYQQWTNTTLGSAEAAREAIVAQVGGTIAAM
jgi:serine/threonine protein phosphatase PrpC